MQDNRDQKQTYQDFETVVVDSGSTDRTLEIVKAFNVTLIEIKPTEFTFPYAINVGIKHSIASKYYVILSAHSLPIGSRWLESAVTLIKEHPKAMGVYGPLKAMPDGTISDTLVHNTAYLLEGLRSIGKTTRIVNSPGPGVLGFTNALVRKDLYEKYPINEAFAAGGEDGDWASHWFEKGYYALKDRRFVVHHSHYLGPIGWWKQFQHWRSVAKPQPYQPLTYRHDPAHTPFKDSD